ncbi:carboxypeptidase regulatory-like domain-containing protein [Silvibacterium sp.]|uniref:TonB-dependent receptor n=1 Tax=Silvibacterium sp. TaxID=1964179 RepID=UPI0039E5FBDD
MKRNSLYWLLPVVLFSFTPLLKAQDVASITGLVTDQTGAVVPNAHVTLHNPATGASYEGVSSGNGSYTIKLVKPGPGYIIDIEAPGFTKAEITGLYMNVDATRTQNVRLNVGSTETVQVSGNNQDVTLDTTDATVGNNFQAQFLNDLPVQDRSTPAALFTQQPGVTLDGAVSGARVDQNNVSVDGLDVNDNATGDFGAIVANAPVDSVQEFRGVGAGELSSAGEGGGGQFELVTRSGTNKFHGALVEYHRDTDMEANDWFNNNSNVARPPLVRNQFGGNVGGPVLKDKLFFFFDYDGRRDTLSHLVERTVPLDSFRNGTLTYVNADGTNSTLSSAQVATLDPQGIGFNQAMQQVYAGRYPHANDLSGNYGDLLNTAGYRFNAPYPLKENNYVGRVDWNINQKMKLSLIGHVEQENSTESAIQFPGDPQTHPYINKSYTYAVQHNWTISANAINQFEFGYTYENVAFPDTYNVTGITQFTSMGGNGSGGTVIDSPYSSASNAQSRTMPVPMVKDDFNWQKGSHSFAFGGTFKWENPDSNTILDYNSPTVGLGGANFNALDASLRPTDITSGDYLANYDSAFALALAPYSSSNATFNYDASGNVLPQGTGSVRDYRYYETELYFGDTWKVTPSLTISYGLRWQNYTVPYERHGLESVDEINGLPAQDATFNNFFAYRTAQSAAGQTGDTSVPFFNYVLGGKANHGPSLYHNDPKNFAPRVAFAFNPSWDRKTVFSGGAGVIYDHTVVNALLYQQTQYSYIFQSQVNDPLGPADDPRGNLQTDPRFGGLTTAAAPAAPAAPAMTTPYTPYVTSGVPYGLAGSYFNEMIDPSFKTPYSIQYNFGWQHEFAQGYILKTTYVGRLGRRLMAQADTSQLINFPDLTSGQTMGQAFAGVEQQLRQGVAPADVTAQPWFENVVTPGRGVSRGYANNTAYLASALQTYLTRGDFADTVQQLAAASLIPVNVGMDSQFSENTMYTNKGFSTYNALQTTLHKNLSYGLQFDLNYTWSHSIDNVSVTANTPAIGGSGFICDVLRPRECRGNSDFDVTNYLSGNFIYDLPFGRGKEFGATMPNWLDEIVGGWKVSGLPSWHTGEAYFAASNAFVAGYANDAPAILTGNLNDMKAHVHGGKGGAVYAYDNPTKADADYEGPIGFSIGSRNNLRGPGFFNMDAGLGKTFALYKSVKLNFRGDAFNVFNHPNFSNPSTDITNSSVQFGTISSMSYPSVDTDQAARVLQVSGRIEF